MNLAVNAKLWVSPLTPVAYTCKSDDAVGGLPLVLLAVVNFRGLPVLRYHRETGTWKADTLPTNCHAKKVLVIL